MSELEFALTAPHNTYNQYQSKFVHNIYFGIILPVMFACVARLTISFPYSDSMSRTADAATTMMGRSVLTINVHDVGSRMIYQMVLRIRVTMDLSNIICPAYVGGRPTHAESRDSTTATHSLYSVQHMQLVRLILHCDCTYTQYTNSSHGISGAYVQVERAIYY